MTFRSLTVCAVALLSGGSALASPSIGRALPSRTQQLLFVEPIRGNLEPALDLLERLLGHAAADEFLDDAPLPLLGLKAAEGMPLDDHGISPEGGLGLFRLPDFDGVVGLVASVAPQKTQAAVRAQLKEQGSRKLGSSASVERWQSPALGDVYLFTARGYVYLVMGDFPEGSTTEQEATLKVVRELQESKFFPLSEANEWKQLSSAAAGSGNVSVFATAPFPLWLNLTTNDDRAMLSGFIRTGLSWKPTAADRDNPLVRAEASPVVVGSFWLGPDALRPFVGEAGSPERLFLASRLGTSPTELAALLASLGNRLTFALHVDAEPHWFTVLDGAPLPYNRVSADLAVKSPAAMLEWLSRVAPGKARGAKSLSTQLRGEELSVEFSPKSVRALLGKPRKVENVNLLAELRRRFGSGTFGPGHASLLLDLETLRRKLLEPIDLSGMSDEEAQLLQELALTWVWQLDPIRYVFVDLAAEKEGLRVRAEMRFHGQEQDARR